MENNILKMPDLKQAASRSRRSAQVEHDLFHLPEAAKTLGRNKKYYLRTYGCQANVRDGETLAGILELMEYTPCDKPEDADLLIFNTCAVRRSAELHVLGLVGALKELKEKHPEKIFCICGCMAQEEAVVKEILKSYPQVDLIFGTHNLYRFPQLLLDYLDSKETTVEVYSQEGEVIEDLPVKRSDSCKAFVDIMYGCNKFCTYCIVPYTRGRERSRLQQDILKEVRALKEQGRKEVILLGQNVNAYGKDLGMEDGFTTLLEEVAETGIDRIRFYTSHPRDYSRTTILAMKKYPNIMKALHLAVQSGSDDVLRRMARGYTIEQYKALVDDMKQEMPEIAFTTDIIVGFPNETDEDFQKTLDLVDYCKYDGAYTFVYSPRSGTPAARMEDNIPVSVKRERLQILNEKVAHYANLANQPYLGKTVKVLCEGPSKKNQNVYTGYSEKNKLVNFSGPAGLEGKIVDVKITEVHSFSLDGQAL
ncbi:MAG: tRNA (N6-isopentenyl adenosine(37)-C2)-methylthiotransferase MiaB [Lactimicrobium sp.]|jgi:tRNA-2-methylthio-N6-dimethylallyladenosine synthase|uniref:tRNA (N6-isopentenyl adenosine(37)-C2)-methylthiotransferase MiaB n=1 Tax=Lactimicrobium sp. TaxID=2563780 RepID=UPI002F351FE9